MCGGGLENKHSLSPSTQKKTQGQGKTSSFVYMYILVAAEFMFVAPIIGESANSLFPVSLVIQMYSCLRNPVILEVTLRERGNVDRSSVPRGAMRCSMFLAVSACMERETE